MAWTQRFLNVFRRGRVDADIDEELQFHIDARTRDNIAAGMTTDEARRDAERLRQQYRSSNADLDVTLVPLQVQVLGTSVPFMLRMLFGAVLCVLLVACANAASLLLARGVARRREMAVRAALGAGRGRIARQLLTESVLLACAAGGLALIAVAWTMDALIALAPSNMPRLDEARVDVTVLLFMLGLSVFIGVLFGLAPALRMSHPGSNDLIHTTTRKPPAHRTPNCSPRSPCSRWYSPPLVLLAPCTIQSFSGLTRSAFE